MTELTIFFTRQGQQPSGIFVATRTTSTGTFGASQPIAALNSTAVEYGPSLTAAGLTIDFSFNPTGSAGLISTCRRGPVPRRNKDGGLTDRPWPGPANASTRSAATRAGSRSEIDSQAGLSSAGGYRDGTEVGSQYGRRRTSEWPRPAEPARVPAFSREPGQPVRSSAARL